MVKVAKGGNTKTARLIKRRAAGEKVKFAKNAPTKAGCASEGRNYREGFVTKKGTVVSPACVRNRKVRADKGIPRNPGDPLRIEYDQRRKALRKK